jgi:Ca2+-binding EF-hand superfamily protein
MSMLLQQQAATAGQDLPSAAATPSSTATTTATPTSSTSAAQFTSDTLSSLLSAQEAPPTSADVAAKLIGTADTDGDGALSLGEIETAIGADTTSGSDGISQAFASLDTNGDGKIGADELTSALDAQQQAQGATQGADGPHRGHHAHHAHHAPPSSSDLAAQVLGGMDADGDGSLSVTELEQSLGVTEGSSAADVLTSAIGKLDANGDGSLSSSELTAGIDAFRAAHHRGGTDSAAAQSTAAQSVTA